jgi:hypothetical protein
MSGSGFAELSDEAIVSLRLACAFALPLVEFTTVGGVAVAQEPSDETDQVIQK